MFNLTLPELQHRLLLLTYIYSYQSGTFTLSSGRSSNYYIDGKQVTMAPEGLYTTAQYILASLQQRRVHAEAIGGLTLGADPIAAAVAILSEIWSKDMKPAATSAPLVSFIVRKETKNHGTRSRIEGPFYHGMRAVIVDDVLTTGASVLNAASAVETAGEVLVRFMCWWTAWKAVAKRLKKLAILLMQRSTVIRWRGCSKRWNSATRP